MCVRFLKFLLGEWRRGEGIGRQGEEGVEKREMDWKFGKKNRY